MQPDLKRERRAGWASLAGALVLCGVALGWYSADESLDAQLQSRKADHDRRTGPEPMAEHVAKQEKANQALVANIEELKKGVGFTVTPHFTLKKTDVDAGTQPGTVFNNRFAEVYDEIANKAHDRGIKYEEFLGFAAEKDTPPGAQVPMLLTMLQLTRRATLIAFATPTPIHEFTIKHDQQPRLTGPKDRPPLQREYGLTMQVKGSLRDVLWILFRLSIADKAPGDQKDWDVGKYPLVLQNLQIDSQNVAEVDPAKIIQQVTATFQIAAIEFLPDDQRAAARTQVGHATASVIKRPGMGSRPGTGASTAPAVNVGARP
jgi:hypothetical protein